MNKEKQNSRSIWDYIKAIGAFGILLSVFSFGFSLAGAWWSSTISNLNQEIAVTRLQLSKSESELAAVKRDYMEFMSENKDAVDEYRDSLADQDTASAILTRTIELQSTETFFDGDVSISLVAIPFEGDPERHMVLANVTGADGSSAEIKDQDAGYSFDFGKQTKYLITITEVETFSATFTIRKL
jgi:hypothetical protein